MGRSVTLCQRIACTDRICRCTVRAIVAVAYILRTQTDGNGNLRSRRNGLAALHALADDLTFLYGITVSLVYDDLKSHRLQRIYSALLRITKHARHSNRFLSLADHDSHAAVRRNGRSTCRSLTNNLTCIHAVTVLILLNWLKLLTL